MNSRRFLILAAFLAATVCVSSTQADTTWLGTNSSDMTDVANWNNGLPGPGNGAMIINDVTSNIPVMVADITLGWDLDIGAGSNTAGRLDQLSGLMSTGEGNWVRMGFNNGSGPASAIYNLADTTGSGGTFTGYAMGSGSLNVGGSTQNGKLNLGWDGGTTSTINVNTAGTISAGEIEVGSTGGGPTSTFNIDNGTVNVLGNFEVGGDQFSGQGGNSFFNMSGGTINTGNEFFVGGWGTIAAQMTGGEINSNAWFVVGRDGASNATLDMSGGTINAAIDNGNSFLVIGAFGGSNGTLNVSGGTINTGDGDTTTNMLIAEGGTGTLNVIGTAPIVNISGDLKLGLFNDNNDSGGVGTIGFTADASGVAAVSVGNDINLSSPDGDFLTVDLSGYSGAHVDMLLIDGSTRQGVFTGLSQGTQVGVDGNNNPYYIDYLGSKGDVWLRTTQNVPEPSTLALVGLSGLALLACRRK
ncbi:PEP-CTERM sorting domain-containing protein [Aeoliella sp.]|uniref:PEP-CTERM sorting domain-containing protein n=1 Tax=Aeoliella sp. TaxID=2795800 RepID=UPI003CCB7F84